MALVQSVVKHSPYEPNSTLYLTTVLCFAGIVFVIMLTRRRRSKSLNLPPSPPKLPIIGNLHQLGILPHRSFRDLANQYGLGQDLMFLQLGQRSALVVLSADAAKEIAKNHDLVFSNRPQSTAAKIFLYNCTEVGFTPYGEDWRNKRKACVLELLSPKSVKSFQSIRQEEVADLVGNIFKACEKPGSSVNLSDMFIQVVNNVVSRCVLGKKCDAPTNGNKSFAEVGRKALQLFGDFSVGDFFPSLGWIDNLTGLVSEMKATFDILDAFFDEVIEEHKSMRMKGGGEQSEFKDFIDIMLQLQENGTNTFEVNAVNLKGMLIDMFVAGTDTTSVTLEWTFTELIRHPNVMRKAQEEVRRIVGNKSKVDEDDLNQMNYLKCVIKEGLRLHPPGALSVPRETTLSSVKVKGYDIPPQTTVFVNLWAIHRDPELWDNPEEFIPERFESNQIDFKGQNFQLIPFGIGRRSCPGQTFAVAVVELVLANLLNWFDWKLPEDVSHIDMGELHGLAVTKKIPLQVEPILYSAGFKA